MCVHTGKLPPRRDHRERKGKRCSGERGNLKTKSEILRKRRRREFQETRKRLKRKRLAALGRKRPQEGKSHGKPH